MREPVGETKRYLESPACRESLVPFVKFITSRHADASKSPAQTKPLAPMIDAMLLAGSMTMKGILRELRRKASAACRGRDLKANVRARIYWFKRKGCRLERSAQSRLQVLPPPSQATSSE